MSAMTAAEAQAQAARLRARLERRFALRDLGLELSGDDRPCIITLPADPDAPLDQMAARQSERQAARRIGGLTAPPGADRAQRQAAQAAAVARATVDEGAHLPYWALLWPSGQALAEELLSDPAQVRGARTLELGCGLGVTAAVALALGARLTVSDLFADALLFTEYNALRRARRLPATLLLNWRTTIGREWLLSAAPFDLLLAADVLYEPEDIDPLLALAPRLVRPGAAFWLAEPGRKASRAFVEQALGRGWRDTPRVTERAWPPDGDVTRVVVHRFALP